MTTVGIPFGNYRLLRRLARGGMAEVFLATQIGPNAFERTVAVKRILPHLADDPQFVEMFMDEARLAAQLSHPNVAHIYEFGRVDDSYFIAMEYIDGIDLSAVVLGGLQRPLPFEHAARIIAEVCGALHYAHTVAGKNGRPLGLVHRDISPQNILVAFAGGVKVVDFGIAKAAIHVERTKPGVVRGKYTYMSPEQVEGKPLDGRADIFCAGIVLYELCTSDALFPRANPILAMRRIRGGDIPRPLRAGQPLPPKLEEIITRSLARRREDRYRTAAELQMDLEGYLHTAVQISNSIVLGEYFTTHYRTLRTSPALADQAVAAPDRTLGVVHAGQGTAPVGQALAARSADKERTLIVGEPLRPGDLDGRTQVRPPSPAAAAGSIHALDTALRAAASYQPLATSQVFSDRPLRPLDPAEPKTSAYIPLLREDSPDALVAQATAGGAIDVQSTLVPLLHTMAGVTVDPTLEQEANADLTGGQRLPPAPRGATTLSLRSFGRRALVVALITVVAVAGVLAGYFLFAPAEPRPPATRDVEVGARRPALDVGAPRPAADQHVPGEAGAAAPREGMLHIQSRPEGATITVDGMEQPGTTPVRRAFFAGAHTVVVSYPGFEDRAQRVRLEAGQTLTINLTLRRLPGEQVVTLKQGEGKKGVNKGQNKGQKTAKKGGKKGSKKRPREDGAPRTAVNGYLSIATIPWSTVYLGAQKIGVTPFANVSLPAGKHRLRFVDGNGATHYRQVLVQAEQLTKLNFTLPGKGS